MKMPFSLPITENIFILLLDTPKEFNQVFGEAWLKLRAEWPKMDGKVKVLYAS